MQCVCTIFHATRLYSVLELYIMIIPFWNFVKGKLKYNTKKDTKRMWLMKTRKHEYGNANLIGRNVERLRKSRKISQKDFVAKMQVLGCDINSTSYSKLEGQCRKATDKEVFVIAKLLDVGMEELF